MQGRHLRRAMAEENKSLGGMGRVGRESLSTSACTRITGQWLKPAKLKTNTRRWLSQGIIKPRNSLRQDVADVENLRRFVRQLGKFMEEKFTMGNEV